MASYSIRLYKDTGFDLNNIPDSQALLDSNSYIDVDAIWVYQNQEQGKIRIKTNFNSVYSVDYCRIGTGETAISEPAFYFVTNVTMINPVTAELDLEIDAITTIGLANITNNILGGWCTRRSVTDDTLFNNCIDEDFTPTQPLEHDTQELIIPSDGILVVVSTIDLQKVSEKLSQGYKNSVESTEVDVSVPTVPAINFNYTKIIIDYEGLQLTRELVGKRMYYAPTNNQTAINNLTDALTTVWSLGLFDSIAGIYYLPIGPKGSGARFTYEDITDIDVTNQFYSFKELTVHGGFFQLDKIPFKWNTSTIHNNKVFATRYNNYRLVSMVSGNEANYYAGDIYDKLNKPTAPTISVNIDGSDNGTTYAKPEYIKGVDLSQSSKPYEIMRDAVTGGDWVSINYNQSRPKGITKSLTALNIEEAYGTLASVGSGLSALSGFNTGSASGNYIDNIPYSGTGSKMSILQKGRANVQINDYNQQLSLQNNLSNLGQIGSIIPNFVSSLFNSRFNKARRAQAKANAIVQTPQTWFPIDNTLSLFYGNSYYVIRERLSDADTLKFDKYLTMYGYAVNEPLTKDCFYGRQYFNYIECSDLSIGKLLGTFPLRLKQLAIEQLEGGIRIWHTQVNQDAYNLNPIVGS